VGIESVAIGIAKLIIKPNWIARFFSAFFLCL